MPDEGVPGGASFVNRALTTSRWRRTTSRHRLRLTV